MSLTPQEAQALKDIEAAAARGEDVFGDDEEIVAASHDAKADADPAPGDDEDADDSSVSTSEAGDAKADDALSPEALAEIANPTEDHQPKAEPFKAAVPEDYKVKRAELMKSKGEAMRKLMDGEIDAEQFAEIESGISDQLEDLTAQRIRAETLIEANTQTQQAYQEREIQKLIARTKGEVDYAGDQKAVKQFDSAMALLIADPDNAKLEYPELIDMTHRMVASMRGVQVADKGGKAGNQPERKPSETAPVTLRSLPTASTPNSNGNIVDQLARLKGPDYERAFSKLSPADRRALLDETEDA